METSLEPMKMKAMMADYPLTHGLHTRSVFSSKVHLELADVKVANHAFKRTVRNLEFDVSELAIVTFLQAHEAGIPLVLLPTVIVSRFQHPFLMFNAKRGQLKPQDLKGKRIGVRSYAVTTVTWIRGMLLQDYGIAPDQIDWFTFEDAHVEQWTDPPNAHRLPEGSVMLKMLEDGQLDAAVLGAVPTIQTFNTFPPTLFWRVTSGIKSTKSYKSIICWLSRNLCVIHALTSRRKFIECCAKARKPCQKQPCRMNSFLSV